MTLPGSRSAPTRVTISDNLIKLILVIFVVPAPFEITIGIVKRESYDYQRLGVIVTALMVLAILLAVLRNRRLYVQSIVGYYLMLAGAIVATFGVLVVFDHAILTADRPWSSAVTTAVSALAPSIGLLLVACGIYLVHEQRRRGREDLDAPGPAGVASPRTIKHRDDSASLWKSDLFGTRPGAQVIVDLCTAYLSPLDLHFVAFYTYDGECLFYLDLLDQEALTKFDVVDRPERRRLYEHQGRHIRALAGRLDKRLRGLDSGALVRIVLDVRKGALFYYNLDREGFLIGVTLDQGQVDQTDAKLSALANEILVSRGGRPSDDFTRAYRPPLALPPGPGRSPTPPPHDDGPGSTLVGG